MTANQSNTPTEDEEDLAQPSSRICCLSARQYCNRFTEQIFMKQESNCAFIYSQKLFA